MFEALTQELDRWLEPLTNETKASVADSSRPTRVVFQPWVDPLISSVEVRITDDAGPGPSLTILATAKEVALPMKERRWVRYRLGTLFGAALRDWVDEPHY
jgi:hypothetical protein